MDEIAQKEAEKMEGKKRLEQERQRLEAERQLELRLNTERQRELEEKVCARALLSHPRFSV